MEGQINWGWASSSCQIKRAVVLGSKGCLLEVLDTIRTLNQAGYIVSVDVASHYHKSSDRLIEDALVIQANYLAIQEADVVCLVLENKDDHELDVYKRAAEQLNKHIQILYQ